MMLLLHLVRVITKGNYIVFVSVLPSDLRGTVEKAFIDFYSIFLVIAFIPAVLR